MEYPVKPHPCIYIFLGDKRLSISMTDLSMNWRLKPALNSWMRMKSRKIPSQNTKLKRGGSHSNQPLHSTCEETGSKLVIRIFKGRGDLRPICPDLRFLLPQPASLHWGLELRPRSWSAVKVLIPGECSGKTVQESREGAHIIQASPSLPRQADTIRFQMIPLLILGFPFGWTSEVASETNKGVNF